MYADKVRVHNKMSPASSSTSSSSVAVSRQKKAERETLLKASRRRRRSGWAALKTAWNDVLLGPEQVSHYCTQQMISTYDVFALLKPMRLLV